MEAQDKIFIPTVEEAGKQLICTNWWPEDNRTQDEKAYIGAIQYIRKDALLEKLNRARELRIKAGAKESSEGIRVIDALTNLINGL